VSSLDPAQLEVAQILFGLPAAAGFALAGGSALIAHGAIERPTRDIDAFIAARPGTPPGDVRPLVGELVDALAARGWKVAVVREHVTFSRLVATRASTSVEIDLAVDSPPLFPTVAIDDIPTLATQDLAARKVLAIIDRAEGRDFTDLHVLQLRYGRDDCISWAQELDAGLGAAAIGEAFKQLDRLEDNELPTDDPKLVRTCFADWSMRLAKQ